MFVSHEGGTCQHRVTFLHQEPGEETFEIGRFYGNYVRSNPPDDFRGCRTVKRYVQTLFQSEIV